MLKRKFKYIRSAFKPLPVKLEHMNIDLSFFEDRVEGSNTLFITALKPTNTITLDARALEIKSVEQIIPYHRPLKYRYLTAKNKLSVRLAEEIEEGSSLAIRIKAVCHPSDNILEGIYRDTTSPGHPQQYMSQCQQWGFQRILPVFDDCTAKCTMITRLEGDVRYTHLISNGNISRTHNPNGKAKLVFGKTDRQEITYQNLIPMTPYLFLACAGTWEVLSDTVTLPSGRTVALEYLVPLGKIKGAKHPMEILKDSMLWHARTQSYEYKRDVYRTICMEKSNFGGMENVGNTTIVTDAALIDEFTSDPRLKYAHSVIIHEFEHNRCGSDVTMETPFDLWLNEAFTVDVERQYTAYRFDPDNERLDTLEEIRAPIGGPLAIEDAGFLGNVVRKGFNDPDELIDGLTYVKGAEIIRMLKLILGEETFRRGADLYFDRYRGSNANTTQFFECFEEVSGRSLARFKKEWLYTIGYPHITAKWHYFPRSRKLKISFKQTRKSKGGAFHLPIVIAAVAENRKDIPETAVTLEITGKQTSVEFSNVQKPAFISFNRGYSFYGTFEDLSSTDDALINQAMHDSDKFNRVEAMNRLTDIEKIRLISDDSAELSSGWLDVYGQVLEDNTLSHGIKARMLHIDEQTLDRKYLPCYPERYAARKKIMKAVAYRHSQKLLDIFHSIDTKTQGNYPWDGLEKRNLKAVLLRTLIELDDVTTQQLAEDEFREAWNFSAKRSALSCIYNSSHPRRMEIMEKTFGIWKNNISSYASYLGIIGSGRNGDVFDLMDREEKRPEFNINHPSHNRALFLPMTSNNKMLWTDQGLEWLAHTVIKLACVNEMVAGLLLSSLQLVNKMGGDLQQRVIEVLRTIKDSLTLNAAPSLSGRIDTYLSEKT